MKKMVVFLLVLLGVLMFSNALQFVPKHYDALVYIPDISRLYDAIKQTETGNIFATQMGLEQMIFGVVESQLTMQGYTLDDIDIFNELLVVVNGENDGVVVLGPSKDPDEIKNIIESFLGNELPPEVKIVNGYFVLGENFGGGSIPKELEEFLNKGYLAVSYINTDEEDFKVKGYGYAVFDNKELKFSQQIVPQDENTREVINEVNLQMPRNILEDENIGGDFFGFINRKLPKKLLDYLQIGTDNYIDYIEDFDGTAYISGDISAVLTNALSGMEVSSVPYYGVIYYKNPTWDMIEGVKTFKNINGEKYGIVETEDGTPVTYINISNDKIRFYGVAPNEYNPGSKEFIKQNYKSDYIMGLFVDLKSIVFNFIGIESDSYLKINVYIEDGKIIENAVLK